MFYSQLLLSKKGALGIVWMAAHCHKRLKKDQVQQTNISSSVDKILDDEVPVVTHRILAFLLLGIVRIYSKKVEYLFHDCHEIMNRLCGFKTGKSTPAGAEVSRTHYHSITLPKRFELDTFDLDLLEDQDVAGQNVGSREQNTLTDEHRRVCCTSGLLDKDSLRRPWKNIPVSDAYTPPRDVFGSHHMDRILFVSSSNNMNISLAGVESVRGKRFSLEDRLEPMVLDEAEEEQMHNKLADEDVRTNFQGQTNMVSEYVLSLSNNKSHLLPNTEILRGTGFTLEDSLEPVVLDEAEEEQMHNKLADEDVRTNFQRPTIMESESVLSLSNNRSHFFPNTEILRGTGFALEDRLEPMVLDEAEKEQLDHRSSNGNARTNFQELNSMEQESVLNLSNNRSHLLPSIEILHGTGFALDHCLQPMALDEADKEHLAYRPSNGNIRLDLREPSQEMEFDFVANQSPKGSDTLASPGALHESGFSLEQFPNFKMSNEAKKGQGYDNPSDEEHRIEEERVEHLSTELNLQEGEHGISTGSVNKAKPVEAMMKLREVITPGSGKCQRPEEFCTSIVPPHSKLPGAGTTDVTTVQTPGRKERAKILKKRKILLDLTTIVPNKVFKNWIEDPTDLKRGKRKTPHTLLDTWRARKLAYVPQSFFEPLIPSISTDLGYLECKKSRVTAIKSVELSAGQDGTNAPVTYADGEQIPDVRSPVTENCPGQTPHVRSPVTEKSPVQTLDIISHLTEKCPGQTPDIRSPVTENSPVQTPIAPGTPVAHLNPLRSHEPRAVADSDIVQPAVSFESTEKWPSSTEQLELDNLFQEETSSCAGDSLEEAAYSARTRMTGSYLCKKFLDRKIRKGEEVLNLSRLLAGKTRKESARLFYEILVLKTRDCIGVQQENAYHDILLRETPKLRQVSGN